MEVEETCVGGSAMAFSCSSTKQDPLACSAGGKTDFWSWDNDPVMNDRTDEDMAGLSKGHSGPTCELLEKLTDQPGSRPSRSDSTLTEDTVWTADRLDLETCPDLMPLANAWDISYNFLDFENMWHPSSLALAAEDTPPAPVLRTPASRGLTAGRPSQLHTPFSPSSSSSSFSSSSSSPMSEDDASSVASTAEGEDEEGGGGARVEDDNKGPAKRRGPLGAELEKRGRHQCRMKGCPSSARWPDFLCGPHGGGRCQFEWWRADGPCTNFHQCRNSQDELLCGKHSKQTGALYGDRARKAERSVCGKRKSRK